MASPGAKIQADSSKRQWPGDSLESGTYTHRGAATHLLFPIGPLNRCLRIGSPIV